MTGKEILQEEFDRAGMRGYKAEEVDAFLQKVAEYVDQLNAEKDDLTYKLQVLADKIEEYKADEENIREALLGAQKLGSSMLNEAKAKAEALTSEAKESAESLLSQAKLKVDSLTKESLQKANAELTSIKRNCELEQRRLDHLRKEVGAFKTTVLQQYKAQLTLLSNLPSFEEGDSAPAEDSVAKGAEAEAIEAETETVIESENSAPRSETINTPLSAADTGLQQEEREQTKEFDRSAEAAVSVEEKEDSAQAEEQSSFFTPGRPARPNYVEKFGELKFGDFGDKEK